MVNLSTTILLATVAVCSAGDLLIEDLTDGVGNCKRPSKEGDTLKMHYTGTLASNGKQFDSSIGRGPFEFKLGAGRVIKGWDQGLSGMCPGDKRKLTIPPELGYGSRGAGEDIPGGATLVFEVQLVGIDHGEQYSDVRPEVLPEDKSTTSDNEMKSGETSSNESQEACEPPTCDWLGGKQTGFCSRTPIPGYTNTGQAECGMDCNCYILNPRPCNAGRNSTLVPYTGSNVADAVKAYVNSPENSEAGCCIGIPPPICTELGCCCGVQNEGVSSLAETVKDYLNKPTEGCCPGIPPPLCTALECCCTDQVNGSNLAIAVNAYVNSTEHSEAGCCIGIPPPICTGLGCCCDVQNDGCILDGITYPDGSLTPDDRCVQYQCDNGAWEYYRRNSECGICHSTSSTGRNSSIGTYDDHLIDGLLIPSYSFDGPPGSYCLSQAGLGTRSDLGVKTTFEYTDDNESRITNVIYTQPGITVEFETAGPNGDAKVLVDGKETGINPDGSMTSFNSTVGTVYISNDSPIWPIPNHGGNIHIVGSQGLVVSIYTLNGYDWFVHSYAMPSLENELYGLCNVFTGGSHPKNYTMQSGGTTTNIEEFIESWKVDNITDDGSAEYESPDWITSTDACIVGHNNLILNGIASLADCQVRCQAEETFVCKSVEYHSSGRRCILSEMTSNSFKYQQPCYIGGWSFSELKEEPESAIPPFGICGDGPKIGGCGDGHCIPGGMQCILPLNNCLCNSTIGENYYCCGSPW